jgi:glycosyltransferase involved in cell wall biosynthesis
MPLHILFVSDAPTVSGAEHVMYGHLRYLQSKGYRTSVYYRAANTRLARDLGGRQVATYPTESFSEHVVRTTWRPDHLAHFASRFSRVRAELRDIISRERVDVVHSVMYPASLYVALATRHTRVAHIWHEHGVKHVHCLNAPLYRFVAATCAFVIGPSDAVTNAIGVAGVRAPKLRTVYNGIDLAKFRFSPAATAQTRATLGLAEGQPAVGLFGQLLPHKGHRLLIAAAPRILKVCPNARFFIVGSLENPPYLAELRAELHAAGLTQQFEFTGWRRDVPELMSAVDVVVVPTITPEPAALSLMEGMALSRPLVASNTGGTAELVVDGSTGLLFPTGDSDELAAQVLRVLTDSALARSIGAAGRRRMEERFSEERHFDEMAQLYAEAAAQRDRV